MELAIFEAMWEEIRARDGELSGRRVRITLLDEEPTDQLELEAGPDVASEPTLDILLAGRIGKFNFGPPDLSRRTEEIFGEIVEQKHATKAADADAGTW